MKKQQLAMCKRYNGFGGVRVQILTSISVLPDWESYRKSATKTYTRLFPAILKIEK